MGLFRCLLGSVESDGSGSRSGRRALDFARLVERFVGESSPSKPGVRGGLADGGRVRHELRRRTLFSRTPGLGRRTARFDADGETSRSSPLSRVATSNPESGVAVRPTRHTPSPGRGQAATARLAIPRHRTPQALGCPGSRAATHTGSTTCNAPGSSWRRREADSELSELRKGVTVLRGVVFWRLGFGSSDRLPPIYVGRASH